ncbi:iron-containing alcohol dehydrogenase [Cupriavidus pampae]|uniref:1,3-propanediol dehydrogenase n=1 Tax=Cupriavidus pampae TaxID=659251 RepID=A0ABN7YPK2_9BURK|nr:iron-containing alcohol dehydrogenase [Cupriavidus pampae]CAG9174056.1 1,3-propanediol dehydrogenase [Cupriavidus pampae]
MALINYITQIQIDFGAVALLAQECERISITRPLVVTDAGVKAAGIAKRVLEQLPPGMEAVIYDGTPSNPTERAMREAVALYRDYRCDGIIAVGGGSPIDLAKGVAVCATHDGPLRQFAAIEGGVARITAATAPVIAIPTTAGTGSEVGRGAVLILDDGRKVGVLSPHIVPRVAICDPELTFGLPRSLTAATGMDAIAHCMETFMAPAFNPPADGIALDGLRRAWRHIERAVNEPQDREARLSMMSASMQGALAFQKGLGCVHSLSHALGGLMPTLHHGTLNAVLLPAVIRFNADAPSIRNDERLQRMAQAMDLPRGEDPGAAIADMSARLALPTGLAAMGVDPEIFPRVIEYALQDHCHKTNPRVASPEDYLAILTESM